MDRVKTVKLLIYIFIVQVLSILFAILIEKSIDLIVEKFNVKMKMEILIIFGVLILGLIMLYVIYKQIYSLLVFEPITNSIFSEDEKKAFWTLLNKMKNGTTLSEKEKEELQKYIDKSPLPTDFVSTYSSSLKLTRWNKIILVIMMILLSLLIKNKKYESNRDNK